MLDNYEKKHPREIPEALVPARQELVVHTITVASNVT